MATNSVYSREMILPRRTGWADEVLVGSKTTKRDFSKLSRGGGGSVVMIWTGISWKGKTNLVVLKGSLDTITYTDMLTGHFLPFADDQYSEGCVVQQENAPAHSAKQTREYLWR